MNLGNYKYYMVLDGRDRAVFFVLLVHTGRGVVPGVVEKVRGLVAGHIGQQEIVTAGVVVVTAGVAGVGVGAGTQQFLVCEGFQLRRGGIKVPRSLNPAPSVGRGSLVKIVPGLY